MVRVLPSEPYLSLDSRRLSRGLLRLLLLSSPATSSVQECFVTLGLRPVSTPKFRNLSKCHGRPSTPQPPPGDDPEVWEGDRGGVGEPLGDEWVSGVDYTQGVPFRREGKGRVGVSEGWCGE